MADYIEGGYTLAPEERLEAARLLRLSVDQDAAAAQATIDSEWDAVIRRRIDEIRSGQVTPVNGRESFARVQARLDELT